MAQPDRFWSVSFNSEASMLSGAVVGGNSDITSIYYNPAGISQIEAHKLVLNTSLIKFDIESYDDYMGENTGSQDFGFRVQPRFVSYTFRSPKIQKLSFQFAIFNRNFESKSIYAQENNSSHYYLDNVGERTIKNYDYKSEYSDYWSGLGLSYQFTPKFFVGISLLGSLKFFNYDKNMFVITSPNPELLPSSVPNYIYNFNSYERIIMYDGRVTAKIGALYQINQWSFGLNLSLPSFRVIGNSDVKRKIELTEFPDENGISHTSLQNEFAQYRVSGFKEPLSIALGFVYYSENKISQYYFTTEYFSKIETYYAIDGSQSVYPQYTEGSHFSSYKYGSKEIINVAIGYKRILSKNFDLIAGFRTDFNSYSVRNDGEFENINEIDKVHNDLYHLTIGSNFNWKKASFILGFENTYGALNNTESLMKINGSDADILSVEKGTMDYQIYSLGLFLGFSFDF